MISYQYGIQYHIAYFTIDNASDIGTYMAYLGTAFEFDHTTIDTETRVQQM